MNERGENLEVVPELDTAKKWQSLGHYTSLCIAAAFFLELDRMHGIEVDFPKASEDALYEIIRTRVKEQKNPPLPAEILCAVSGRVQPLCPEVQDSARTAIENAIGSAECARDRYDTFQLIDHWTGFLKIVASSYAKYGYFRYREIMRDVHALKYFDRGERSKYKHSLGLLFLIAENVIRKWNH